MIAYFSAEFALVNKMPSYAGGLGILAGDYILESTDQNFPITGISLYYHKDGHENAKKFGLRLVKKSFISKLLIEIPIENRTVFAQVWHWQKGKVSVYFLDTNIKKNSPKDRQITETLYVEDRDLRLKQELVLGIGGTKLLKELNILPDLYHLNEGHSAFLCLKLISEEINKGLDFQSAVEMAKRKVVFTNHTLVAEGQEMFTFEALIKNTEKLCTDLNLNISDIMKLGDDTRDGKAYFSMTRLALNMANTTNAVSKLHGEKARELWPNYPIIHITNGIYIPRWDKIGKQNLFKANKRNEEKLLKIIHKTHGDKWNEEALLVGWSRRFVPYKQPLAILEDIEKLKQLANHFKDQIHIVFSAPLDEKNSNHNEFLNKIYDLMNGELKDLITFIPNYRVEIGEVMVAGCDIWLNTPIVGREACGTSGMKAALNGAVNLSTDDGWINEVSLEGRGWLIGEANIGDSILEILEQKVLPIYNSPDWKKYMERSRQMILENFSTTRMLREYNEKLYQPNIPEKKLYAFDVDGTLALPRRKIDREMARLLKKLLTVKKVAIISGGAFPHIKKQVLDKLNLNKELLKNLILLPTNGGGFYIYDKAWKEIFSHKFTDEEKAKIISAIKEIVSQNPDLQAPDIYGDKIQDRDSEITYSALGEKAPVKLKQNWDTDFKKRLAMQTELMKKLPDCEVKIGGTTSIDITPKGMDKAYGIEKLMDYLKLNKRDITFFGDAVYQNGNDFPVLAAGIDTVKVSGPQDTKSSIIKILEKNR